MLRTNINIFFFFFKQKTAYEMRISDWSSDVCSSDLARALCPMVERLVVIARLDLLLAALEPGIAEVGGLFVDAGKLVTVGIDDRHVPFAYHVDERLIAEALVAHLDRVAQLQDRKSTRLNSSH